MSHFKKVHSILTDTNLDVDEEDDDLLDTDTNLAQSSSNNGQSSTDGLRRSQRNRRPVVRFGQEDN